MKIRNNLNQKQRCGGKEETGFLQIGAYSTNNDSLLFFSSSVYYYNCLILLLNIIIATLVLFRQIFRGFCADHVLMIALFISALLYKMIE